jgi:hypothetical protein
VREAFAAEHFAEPADIRRQTRDCDADVFVDFEDLRLKRRELARAVHHARKHRVRRRLTVGIPCWSAFIALST